MRNIVARITPGTSTLPIWKLGHSAGIRRLRCGRDARAPRKCHNEFLQGWIHSGIRFLAVTLLLTSPLRAQQIYDLLLKNGQVIDPKNQRNGRYDVAVIGNRIVRVGENLPSSNAKLV